jgi:hypothetical protein
VKRDRQERLNARLMKLTGYELRKPTLSEAPRQPATPHKRRAAPKPARIAVPELRQAVRAATDPATASRLAAVIGPSLSPVLILAAPRAGGPQLQNALSLHSEVYAPEALPLLGLRVQASRTAQEALAAQGLRREDLDNMLMDHLVRERLARSSKASVFLLFGGSRDVAAQWRRLKDVWPAARFIHLIRNPAEVLTDSAVEGVDPAESAERLGRILEALLHARQSLPGLTVRYEDLASEPDRVFGEIFDFAGLPPEGVTEAFSLPPGQPAAAKLELNDRLASVARNWGYS